MRTRPLGTARRRGPARRVLALVVLSWLNLLILPCQAGLPVLPAFMDDCDHGGGADHHLPCLAMQASDCESPVALDASFPPAPVLVRAVSLGMVIPDPPADRTDGSRRHPAATGPPLIIRFCTLRN